MTNTDQGANIPNAITKNMRGSGNNTEKTLNIPQSNSKIILFTGKKLEVIIPALEIKKIVDSVRLYGSSRVFYHPKYRSFAIETHNVILIRIKKGTDVITEEIL
jgi:hypothetical protein